MQQGLIQHGQVTIPGIGTLKVKSRPSLCEPVRDRKFVLHPPKIDFFFEEDSSLESENSLISGFASKLNLPEAEAAAILQLIAKELLDQIPVEIPGLGTLHRSESELCFSAATELSERIAGAFPYLRSIEIEKETPRQVVKRRQKRPWAIILPLGVITAVVVGYFVSQNGVVEFFPQPSRDTTTSSVVINSDSISGDSIAGMSSLEHEATASTDSLDIEPPLLQSEARPATTDALLLDRQLGGYTIILGSFATLSQALTVVEQYRILYPSIPVDTLMNPDNTRYRVAIGQTSTIPEALALKSRLSQLPSGSWIFNILNTDL